MDGSGTTCFEVDWRGFMLERMGSLIRLSVEAILSVSAYGVHSQSDREGKRLRLKIKILPEKDKVHMFFFFTRDKVYMFTNYIHLFIFFKFKF